MCWCSSPLVIYSGDELLTTVTSDIGSLVSISYSHGGKSVDGKLPKGW